MSGVLPVNTLGLPLPPLDAVFNLHAANIVSVACIVTVIGVTSVLMRKPGHRALVMAMMLGAAATTFMEPIFDIVTSVWHPTIGQNIAFTLLGREVPFWAFPGYMNVYGCAGSLMLIAFTKGVTRRAVWLWCLAPLLFDFVIEETMLHFNLYYYYGNQPFVLIKFPLYQAACNTVGVFLGVTLLYVLSPYLNKDQWKWLPAALVVVPLCGAAGFVATSVPAAYAIAEASLPNWLTQLCGAASWAIALLFVQGVSLLVAIDSPWRESHRYPLPASGTTLGPQT